MISAGAVFQRRGEGWRRRGGPTMAVKPDSFPRDMKIAVRPLARTRGLAITVVASVMPAARAARVDVMEALRSE